MAAESAGLVVGLGRRRQPVMWLPANLLDASHSYLVIDGFSCRAQLEHLGPDLAGRATTLAALVRARAVAAPR